MNYFKKIFELDPKEVETFIENRVKEYSKKCIKIEEDYNEWLNDYDIKIYWYQSFMFRLNLNWKQKTTNIFTSKAIRNSLPGNIFSWHLTITIIALVKSMV